MDKIEWEPDFTINEEDRCPATKGGHEYILDEETDKYQILVCTCCGYRSYGWF